MAKDEDDEEGEEGAEDKPECAEVPLGPDPEILPEKKVQEPAVKSIYLRRADFTKHGWTEGCAKCRFMLLHLGKEGGPISAAVSCLVRLVQN